MWRVEITRYCRLELALLPVLWLLRDRVVLVLERHGKQERGAGGSAVLLSCLVQLQLQLQAICSAARGVGRAPVRVGDFLILGCCAGALTGEGR